MLAIFDNYPTSLSFFCWSVLAITASDMHHAILRKPGSGNDLSAKVSKAPTVSRKPSANQMLKGEGQGIEQEQQREI